MPLLTTRKGVVAAVKTALHALFKSGALNSNTFKIVAKAATERAEAAGAREDGTLQIESETVTAYALEEADKVLSQSADAASTAEHKRDETSATTAPVPAAADNESDDGVPFAAAHTPEAFLAYVRGATITEALKPAIDRYLTAAEGAGARRQR
jgi:hypothetical protein